MERILFDHVWKKYDRRYGSNRFRRLPQLLLGKKPDKYEFWALRDVNFRLEEGKSLGIIGPNGSGKTTILRILSGICHINQGHVRVRGTISALIALGAGFHPELTGRENIYLNGSILGLRRDEIKRYLKDIVDFAGIGDYIDSPVKRYSSGMFVRLGFAVAAQVRPDILLVDEVLAVGDARFQAACHERIRELREQGTIIILVSHDMWAIRQSCAEGILLYKGEMQQQGDIAEVLESYDKLVQKQALEQHYQKMEQQGAGPEENVVKLEIRNHEGETGSEIPLGEPVKIRAHYQLGETVAHPCLVLVIYSHSGPVATVLRSRKEGWETDRLEGRGYVDIDIEELRLNPGRYAVQLTVKDEQDLTGVAFSHFQELFVQAPSKDWCSEDCLYVPPASWSGPFSENGD